MRGVLRRSVHWLPVLAVLFLAVSLAPGRTADAGGELATALRAAGEGGLDRLSALRMMLWTEPQGIAPFVLPRPSPAEEARLGEAEARAKAALAARPDLLPALVLLGRLAWIADRPDEAADYYRHALSFTPGYGPALLGLTDIHLDRREADRAAAFLAQIQGAESGLPAETALRRAVLALWRGDGPGAVSALAAVEPPSGEGFFPYLFFLAKGYFQSGLVREAAALLAREVPPWAGGLWAEEYGLALYALGDKERASTELGRATAFLPGHPLPRWERAAFALERRDAAGAAAMMTEEPIGLGGLTAAGLFLYGLAKEDAKDYAAAAKAYTRLVELRPRLGLAYYHLGRALYSAQRYGEALRCLGQGIAVSPGLPCLYLQRAEVYERLKMKKQAAGERAKAASLGAAAEGGGWRLSLSAAEGAGLIGLVGRGTPPQGIFFSRDGRYWLWRPWHGSAVAVEAGAGQSLYVSPDGTDGEGPLLSGSVPSPAPRDLRPPAFLRPCTVERAEGGPFLCWGTDEPTRAELRIWPRDGSSGGLRLALPEYGLWHRISLADLLPGGYSFTVTIADAAGNTSTSEPAPLTIEPMTPTTLAGSVSVDGGASVVKDRRVNLVLSLEGAADGALVRIANEDGRFTEWRPIAAAIPWELSPGDGEKIVSVQFRRGNLYSPVYAVRLVLDTRPPAIYGLGLRLVTETEAVLSWRTDEPSDGRVELWQAGSWVAVFFDPGYTEGHEAPLSGLQPGTRYTVRVFAADRAGNLAASLPYEFETVSAPDWTPPTGRLLINAGAQYTNSIYVTLTIEGNDYESGLREMSLSNDGIVWSMPEPYAPTKAWRLQPGDGTKTVFLRLIDRAGNPSPVITARIILDTRPPAIEGLSSQVLPDGRLLFTWRTREQTYGLVQLGTVPSFPEPSEAALRSSALSEEHTAVMAPPGKVRIVYYRVAACDEAGNRTYSGIGSLTIPEPDTTGPVGGIAFADGMLYTRETRVTLVLWAEDPSGIARMRLRNAGGPWGAWEPFAARRSWNLPSGDGEKTVQVRYADGAGNESPIYSARIVLDTRPPQIGAVSWTRVGPDAVEISWRTDEPTLGVVSYGPAGRDYPDRCPEDGAYLQEHRVRITRLAPGRIYYAVVEAVDRAGNRTASPEFTIDLRPAPQQVNFALAVQGAKATAQVWPPQMAKGDPALAIDGRPDTCWTLLPLPVGPLLGGAAKPAEWRLDLKERRRIATIRLILAGRGDFSLEIREGTRWRRLQRVEEKGYPSFLKAERAGVLTLEFGLGAEIEGLRLIWEKVPKEGFRLFEVEAWG